MSDFAYAPDLPPETPNVWMVCDGFHPDIYGNYRTGYLPAAAISTAVGVASAGWHFGFAYQTVSGGGQVLLVRDDFGATNWQVFDGSSWANRYPGAGGVTGVGRNHAAQVGNITLLGGGNGMFSRDASTSNNFAAVAGSPACSAIAVNALNITLAAGYNGATWYTSDTNAPTTWSGGEAASGFLYQTPGLFAGIGVIGNDFLLFKQQGVYRGTYVGGVIKWTWALVDREKGSYGNESVCSANNRVYFAGPAGVYEYDGAQFTRLDNHGIWRTFRALAGLPASASGYCGVATKLIFDPISRNLYLFPLGDYVSLGGIRTKKANDFFTFNTVSRKWGYQSRLSEAGTTGFNDVFDIGPYVEYGSLNTNPGTQVTSHIGMYNASSDKVEALTNSFNASDLPGTNYKPKLRTSRVGTRGRMTKVVRAIPEWTISDGAGTSLSTATVKTATPYTSDTPNGAETAGTAVTLSTNLYRADYLQTARFQSLEIAINAEAVIAGVTFDATDAGQD
jgi:hypothetical protein